MGYVNQYGNYGTTFYITNPTLPHCTKLKTFVTNCDGIVNTNQSQLLHDTIFWQVIQTMILTAGIEINAEST